MFQFNEYRALIATSLLLLLIAIEATSAKSANELSTSGARKIRGSNQVTEKPNPTSTLGPMQETLSSVLEQKHEVDQDSGFEPDATTSPVLSSRVEDNHPSLKPKTRSFRTSQAAHLQDTSSFASFGELGAMQGRKMHNYKKQYESNLPHWTAQIDNNDELAQNYNAKYGSKKSHSLSYANPPYGQEQGLELSNPIGYPEYAGNQQSLANNHLNNHASGYENSLYNPYASSSQAEQQSFASHHQNQLPMAKWSSLHMKKAELICGAIAISLGAIIVGAPIYLIYLVLQAAMNGSSGSLSLINAVAPNTSSSSLLRSLFGVQLNRKRSNLGQEARNGTSQISAPSGNLLHIYLLPLMKHLKSGEILERLNKAIDKFSKI